MKFTLKLLQQFLATQPNGTMTAQGKAPDDKCIISCKHPKYNTGLYVSEVGRKFIKYTGNIRNALPMKSSTAKNVRDDVLEHKVQVVIHGY